MCQSKQYLSKIVRQWLPMLLSFLWAEVQAQTFFGTSSLPVDNASAIGPTVTITPPASMLAGDLAIIYAQYRNTTGTLTIGATGGQSWNAMATYTGSTQNIRIFWCRFNGTWAANPTVTLGAGTNALSAMMYVFRPSSASNIWAVNDEQVNTASGTNPNVITGYNTIMPNSVTMAFWSSAAANTWGTLTGTGWSKTSLPNQVRNTATSGQSHTAAYRLMTTAGATNNVQQTQSATTTALRSIVSWYEVSNDNCSGAINLTSATACTNTTGTVSSATNSGIAAPSCGGTADDDVWYRFTAGAPLTTISLSGLGANLNSSGARLQLFSGSCGSLTSLGCGTTSLTVNTLTTGTQYYVRVYSAGATSIASLGQFSICITHTSPPANDNCSGAVNLTPNNSCSNTSGNVHAASPSGIAAACGGSADDDVWYRFTAASTDQVITLSGLGTTLSASGVQMELFSGACGSLTSLACGTSRIGATNLIQGAVYFIRVYSSGNTPITANGGFSICITNVRYDFGKSFINLSKPAGGSIETGDQLEIRTSVVVRTGSIDSVGFYDNIPAGTVYIPGTLAIQTNEAKIYKSFTDAPGDDQAEIIGTALSFRLGYTGASQATAFRRGQLTNTMRPSFYNSACIMLITYRVTVTAATFSNINIGGGLVTYSTNTPVVNSVTLPNRLLAVYPNYGVCSNTTGANTLGTESNGTFGSGNLKNRGTSSNVPVAYTFQNFAANQPQDYNYGITNNTSGVYSTNNSLPKPNANRVFTVWDIIGDHTGASNPILGNPATDTTGGNTGGYMLVVNAAYRIDSAFDQTISGLCPNTYYEISAWFRNICSRCGCDSAGRGASSVGYIPTAPGDSSGVYPNVSIGIDGVTYYSSGSLQYSGQWIKRGFIFVTGPAQTSFTMRVYNNAPGGGGNDWALDDISVATCLPELQFFPTASNQLCRNSVVEVSSTVNTFYDNYKYYQWERSTDGGTSWHAAPLKTGVDSFLFTYSGSDYTSTVYYPQFIATVMDNGNLYRLKIATTIANLSNNNCNTYSAAEIVTINIGSCDILPAALGYFKGTLKDGFSRLQWQTLTEEGAVWFEVERSADGVQFESIGKLSGSQQPSRKSLYYTFTDPQQLAGTVFYRLKIVSASGASTYSNIIQLSSNTSRFSLKSVINPFYDQVRLELQAPVQEWITIQLLDTYGRHIHSMKTQVEPGTNSILFRQVQTLQQGNYILLIRTSEGTLQKLIQRL